MSSPRPGDARPVEYRALMAALGIGRVVVVQPNAYGEADRQRILVDNPAELYGFGPVH